MNFGKQHQTAARLQRMFSGDYERDQQLAGAVGNGTAELLVLPGADLGALDELTLSRKSLVLAPGGMSLRKGDVSGAQVLSYDGGLTDGEDELHLGGGIAVRRESYTAAAFVPLTCPTAIAVLEPDDHENFLSDADVAVETGAFEDFLMHPLAVLADVCALGGCGCAAPRRLRAVLDADGARPSLGGARFGDSTPGDTGCTVCVAGVVDPDGLEANRAARPWLPRYLHVLDVLRAIRRRTPGPVSVSGFGHRFVETLPVAPVEPAAALVLLELDGEHVICDPATRRVLRTGRDAMRVLEVALASPGAGLVDEVAAHLHLTTAVASAAVDQLQRTLDQIGFPFRIMETA